MLAGNPKLAAMKSQIQLDMTRDGLRIQIVDERTAPDVRQRQRRRASPTCASCCARSARVLTEVPNRLTLEGHTDAQPFGGGDRGYSNWELSTDRANASRRELVAGGLPDDRMLRVQGLAVEPAVRPQDPRQPGQPPHQHHRDEPRGRGPRVPRRPRRRAPQMPSIEPDRAGAAGRRTCAR